MSVNYLNNYQKDILFSGKNKKKKASKRKNKKESRKLVLNQAKELVEYPGIYLAMGACISDVSRIATTCGTKKGLINFIDCASEPNLQKLSFVLGLGLVCVQGLYKLGKRQKK